ncbi:MAG: Fic family protein [Bacteroidota bacterium]
MKPPYELTERILRLVASISELIGAINATHLDDPTPQLRKRNRIKTIHSSLKIEGNTLTEDQITALLNKKRVIGPSKDIAEVMNAIELYNQLEKFNYKSQKSFLRAHKLLMQCLINDAGTYRTKGVGIVKGSKVKHLAPPAVNVKALMNELFTYLKNDKELVLIKSCVFHYEMEFIHPFLDGNGRMGRLWQTLILMERYPVFQFIPFETLISQSQEKYYQALSASDKSGSSTQFVEYILAVIEQSLIELLNVNNRTWSGKERLAYFIKQVKGSFFRKDYMNVFKDISSATASRDLKKGTELVFFEKKGEKNKTVYKISESFSITHYELSSNINEQRLDSAISKLKKR